MKVHHQRIVAPLILAVCCALSSPAGAVGLPQKELEGALEQLAAYLPPVEGYVISLQGETVYTDIPAAKGLQPGSEVTLVQEGAEIIHPLTKQVLGRYETVAGTLRVEQTRENYSAGSLVAKGAGVEIKPGDRARITSGRLRLATTGPPEGLDPKEWSQWEGDLVFGLEKSTRFLLADIREDIPRAEVLKTGRLQSLAARLSFDLVLVMEPVGGGAERALSLQLYSGASGLRIASALVPLAARPGVGAPAPAQPPAAAVPAVGVPTAPAIIPGALSAWRTFATGASIVSFCYGDLTGSGRGEAVTTDGQALHVFARENQGWKPIWDDMGRTNATILSVDCGDFDGNGKEEIFVTRLVAGQLLSVVLEYDGVAFKGKSGEKSLFYRALLLPGGKRQLLAQSFSSVDPTSPPIKEYVWSDGDYVAKGIVDLPVRSVYGFGYSDLDGDGKPELISLDEQDYLRLYSPNGKLLFKSDEHFGGSSNYIVGEGIGLQQPPGIPNGYLVKGRLLDADLDGDGRRELVLVRNIPKAGYLLPGLRIYEKAELHILRWDGIKLDEVGSPEKLYGYIADYAVVGTAASTEIVLGVNRDSSFFRKGEGSLMSRPLIPTGSGN